MLLFDDPVAGGGGGDRPSVKGILHGHIAEVAVDCAVRRLEHPSPGPVEATLAEEGVVLEEVCPLLTGVRAQTVLPFEALDLVVVVRSDGTQRQRGHEVPKHASVFVAGRSVVAAATPSARSSFSHSPRSSISALCTTRWAIPPRRATTRRARVKCTSQSRSSR